MNKHNIYTWIFIAFSLFSCQKDLGNYTYTDIDEVEIDQIEESYQVLALSELNIKPGLRYQSGETVNKEEYTYEWFTIDTLQNLDSLKVTKLGEEADLSYTVNLPTRSYPYQLHFRMKNKETGKQWVRKVKLTVNSEIGNSWLVLQERDQKAQLDLLNYNASDDTFTPYRNILDGIPIEGKPLLVYYLNTYDLFNRMGVEQVYVGTDQRTYSFNVTGQEWNDYRLLNREIVRPLQPDFHAVKLRSMGHGLVSRQNYCLGNDGKLMFEDNNVGTSYGVGINRLQSVGEVKIAPYIAEKTYASDGQPYAVMYDTGKRRFIVHSMMSMNSAMTMDSFDPVMIDPNNVGMDLVFLEYALNSQSFYALMKSTDGQALKLLRFDTMFNYMMPIAFEEVSIVNGIDQADFYTIDPNYGYLIYAIGNKVFQYDPFNKQHKQLLDLGTRQISLIKFQRFIDKTTNSRYKAYGKQLMVCSYDPNAMETSGTMDFYKIGLSSLPVLEKSYDGFGKIVDVSYRE